MSVDVKASLEAAMGVVQIIETAHPNPVTEGMLAAMKAVDGSPALLSLIQSLIDKFGANASKSVDLNDPALKAIVDEHAAKGAKAISIADIQTLLQFLPTIIQLIQQFFPKKPAT